MAFCWYILRVASGSEVKVVSAIKEQMQYLKKKGKKNIKGNEIQNMLVPAKIIEENNNTKSNAKRKKNVMRGYIFVNMKMQDDLRSIITDIPKVLGFMCSDGRTPDVVSQQEVDSLVQNIESDVTATVQHKFEAGDSVVIKGEGPFAGFNGNIEYIDEKNSKAKVSVSVLGSYHSVEVDVALVEKE